MNAEFQKVIFEALVAAAGVHAHVADRIYDNVPSDRVFPDISFGPADAVPDDHECIPATTETLQIDVWTRENGKLGKCKEIVRAVYDALHEAELSMPDPWALVETRVTLTQVFRDPDGITGHGVLTVQGMIESL